MPFFEPVLAIGIPSGGEWFWIFLLVTVLFGPKKLPEIARGLGRGVGEFRKAKEAFEKELTKALNDPSSPSLIQKPENTISRNEPTATPPQAFEEKSIATEPTSPLKDSAHDDGKEGKLA